MRKFLSYLTALFALCACSSVLEQEEILEETISLENLPVTVTFSVPDVRIASPETKSLEDGDGFITGERYLDPDKLYVVVCGGTQSIKYIRKANLVCDENTGEPVVTVKPVSEITDYPLRTGNLRCGFIPLLFSWNFRTPMTERCISLAI